MNKASSDSKVRKTFMRNYEHRVKTGNRDVVVSEVDSAAGLDSRSTMVGTALSAPTICSSAALANYLSEVKNSGLPPVSVVDLNVDQGELCAKMTKKLNFHVNDRIYRNLVELNSNIEELKTKKDKRAPRSTGSARKDIEPDIEDFCEDENEPDLAPKIPIIKPKYRPLKTVENGRLHKLVASFDVL